VRAELLQGHDVTFDAIDDRHGSCAKSNAIPLARQARRKEDKVEIIQERANKAGELGWELVASAISGGYEMSSPIWCFKRPK